MSESWRRLAQRTSFGPLAPRAATAQTSGGRCQLGSGAGLGSSPSTRAAAATAAGLAGEGTAAALATGAGLALKAATATAAGAAARGVVVSPAIGVGLGAALLDHDALAIHSVGVGGESGRVSGLGLELDEGAVLGNGQSDIPCIRHGNPHTFWRLMSK